MKPAKEIFGKEKTVSLRYSALEHYLSHVYKQMLNTLATV